MSVRRMELVGSYRVARRSPHALASAAASSYAPQDRCSGCAIYQASRCEEVTAVAEMGGVVGIRRTDRADGPDGTDEKRCELRVL
jgi:hypothetical protein